MTSITRDAALSAADLPVEEVPTPEWGAGTCARVRTFEEGELEQFLGFVKERAGHENAAVVAFCAVDDDGKRVFRDEDVAALARKSHKVVGRIALKALQINGLSKSAVVDAKNG